VVSLRLTLTLSTVRALLGLAMRAAASALTVAAVSFVSPQPNFAPAVLKEGSTEGGSIAGYG